MRSLYFFPVVIALCAGAGRAEAQDRERWRYEIGGRSTFMTTTMELESLGAPFDDLEAGGSALAHASGIFVMWPRGDHVRIGVETLVGNSYGDEDTGILFQGAGFLAEYQTGGTWFLAGSVLVGGMIASATKPSGPPTAGPPVYTGAHYKGSGLFAAPSLSVGRMMGSLDIRAAARQVWHVPGTEGLGAFDSFYLGLSVGFRQN